MRITNKNKFRQSWHYDLVSASIRSAMKAYNHTSASLAKKIGVSDGTVRQYASGCTVPSAVVARKIVEAMPRLSDLFSIVAVRSYSGNPPGSKLVLKPKIAKPSPCEGYSAPPAVATRPPALPPPVNKLAIYGQYVALGKELKRLRDRASEAATRREELVSRLAAL